MFKILTSRILLVSFLPGLIFAWIGPKVLEWKRDSFTSSSPLQSFLIRPADMALAGDTTDCGSLTLVPAVKTLCNGMPEGSILLGVDPADANPAAWGGGSAVKNLQFTGIPLPALVVIKISWPNDGTKGIISYLKGQQGSVSWDGVTIWNKRSILEDVAGFFWGAQNDTVFTTAVIRDANTHQLKIDAQAETIWAIGQIQLLIYPAPDPSVAGSLRGAAFSPYRDCQSPNWGSPPSETQVREDLARLQHTSNALRTYSSLGINGKIPALASEYHLPVCAGAWLTREKDSNGQPVANKNREEIDALVNLAKDPNVKLDCMIVGNEVLLFNSLSDADLISYIREVKTKVPGIPVATAEVTNLLLDHPDVVKELDWVLVHIYPYWNYQSIDNAADWVVAQYKKVVQKYPTKHVVIGETGWPSAGPDRSPAHPSLENQRTFFIQFTAAAEREKIDYYYFSPIDEMWKKEGGVGSHWGLLYSDRTGKQTFQSLLMPAHDLLSQKLYLPMIRQAQNLIQTLFGQFFRFGLQTSPKEIPNPKARAGRETNSEFWVYSDYTFEDNHFAPSGWMGDQADLNFSECARIDLNSSDTYIQVSYDPKGPLGWAGIYWQEPAGNWGSAAEKGYNLDNATELKFMAKGSQGGEKIRFMAGGLWGPAPDSQQPAISSDVVTLTNAWQEFSLDLRGRDLSNVIGGFGFTIDKCLDSQPVTVYLDNIRYLLSVDPGAPQATPTPAGPYSFPIYSDQDQPGNHFTPSGWSGDLGDINMNSCYRAVTHTGSTAIRVDYKGLGIGPSTGCSGSVPCKWASVNWQEPSGNWGSMPGSYNLNGVKGLTFWARGENGGELITFRSGGMNCGVLPFPETFCPPITLDPSPLMLTNSWQQYTIPIPAGLDMSRVSGPLVWVAAQLDNPSGATFYLDDIQFLFNQLVLPQPHSIYYNSRLAFGYNMGVNTSRGQTGWVLNQNGFMRMNYPAGQTWGTVFITNGAPTPFPRPGQDFSSFSNLSVDLRGQSGGELVWLGLKDNTDLDNGNETLIPLTLTNSWQTYTIPLSNFTTADLTRLYIVTEFVEYGLSAQTIDFRNIRFLP